MMAATISGDVMSYWERARSLLMNLYDFVTTSDLTQRYYDHLFRAKYGLGFPSVDGIIANAPLQFVNANPFFDLSRPISHKTIYIGGVVEKKPKRLSKVSAREKQFFLVTASSSKGSQGQGSQ